MAAQRSDQSRANGREEEEEDAKGAEVVSSTEESSSEDYLRRLSLFQSPRAVSPGGIHRPLALLAASRYWSEADSSFPPSTGVISDDDDEEEDIEVD